MKYLMIQNDGEIIPEALYMMGASSKRGDSSMIGMFGSGNKYSLALLLRLGIRFKIFSGIRELKVTTTPFNMRDQEFNKILIDGQPTSLTMEMGPQWEDWYIIREIYCNAIDEGNPVVCLNVEEEHVSGSESKTRFYIETNNAHIAPVIDKWDDYFCFDRDDLIYHYPGSSVKIYPNRSINKRALVYRKGVLVYDDPNKMLYSYDLGDVVIDESRVMRNTDNLYNQGAVAWFMMPKSENVEELLSGIDRFLRAFSNTDDAIRQLETEFRWSMYHQYMEKESWLKAIGERVIINADVAGRFPHEQRMASWVLPQSLCKAIANQLDAVVVYGVDEGKNSKPYKIIEGTPKAQHKLKKVLEGMVEIGIFPQAGVHIVEFRELSKVADTADGKILISEPAMETYGIRELILLVLRKQVHINTGGWDSSSDNRGDTVQVFASMYLSELETKYTIFF